jgi:hypothetical protein
MSAAPVRKQAAADALADAVFGTNRTPDNGEPNDESGSGVVKSAKQRATQALRAQSTRERST